MPIFELLLQNDGAKLAEPKTSEEYLAIKSSMESLSVTSFWIGINDRANEGTFVYESDASSLKYVNWGPGEPNNHGSGEDCVHSYFNSWNDLPCNIPIYYVCQIECKSGYEELLPGKCYKMVLESSTYDEANNACQVSILSNVQIQICLYSEIS